MLSKEFILSNIGHLEYDNEGVWLVMNSTHYIIKAFKTSQ